MAIVISSPVENERGFSVIVTGDGASTQPSYKHNRFRQPATSAGSITRTCKAFVVTGWTKVSRRSERGGLLAPEDGTAVTVTSCTEAADGTITITTSPAIGNGTQAWVTVIFDQYDN